MMKIFVAGHTGMVGSAILRKLKAKGYNHFLLRRYEELDLTSQPETEKFFSLEKPDQVYLAAARVGGIVANNTYRAQFIYDNLMIQNNVIHSAWKHGTKKLLFLGSSCIYPREAPQPMKEDYLLTGRLEYTNEPYAIAKIAGIKMCESYYRQYGCDFISVMPTNLYGPNDNYDLEKSHVLPALIRKMHLGKCLQEGNRQALRKDLGKLPVEGVGEHSSDEEILRVLEKYGIKAEGKSREGAFEKVTVTLWGDGMPRREFLHVDDMASACVHVMEKVDAPRLYKGMGQTHINIGTGEDLTIKELAQLVKKVTRFEGGIKWDTTKPGGTPRKLLDVKLLGDLGWKYETGLEQGIRSVYEKYV